MVRIRPATPRDATPMLRLHREAVFAKAAAHYAPATLSAWGAGATPERIARMEQHFADAARIVLVAEAADEVIGYAIVTPSRNELGAVYVKPNPFGRVGHALLAEAERQAWEAGAEFLTCSASLGRSLSSWLRRQYSQRSAARRRTSSRVAASICY